MRDEEVIVTVTDKTNVPKDVSSGRYSDRVEFTFNVENKTNKVVKGIQGKLTIYDLFEKEILKFNCDFTGNKISPNDFITVSDLGIDINQFMDTHLKIYNTDFTDLKFKYEVISVVYDDSDTSDSSAVEAIKNQNVTVIVTDKSNLETNYNVGRYSPRVEFSFEVHNNTSKDIKGVQGVLTIKDLFGVDILSVNLDFTGQTISANDSIDVTGMGIDINQFIDEHVKVYNTNLDDMNYEYQVSAIVYSDGTMEQF